MYLYQLPLFSGNRNIPDFLEKNSIRSHPSSFICPIYFARSLKKISVKSVYVFCNFWEKSFLIYYL